MGMQPYIAFQMEIGVYKKLYTVLGERRRNNKRNWKYNSDKKGDPIYQVGMVPATVRIRIQGWENTCLLFG